MKKILIFLFLIALLTGNVCADDPEPAETPGAVTSPGAALKEFRILRGGYNIPQSYKLYRAGDEFLIVKNNEQFFESDISAADELVKIMDRYDIWSWDGFNESDPFVLDGEEFSLSADFTDGRSVEASGNNAFPDNYSEAYRGLEQMLEERCRQKIGSIFGTYVCETEGAGGEFTFTLSEDETYAYCEGPDSGTTIKGNWYLEYGLLMLTDDETYRTNNFLIGSGKLIYTEEWSDNFQTFQIPDGTRFIKKTD